MGLELMLTEPGRLPTGDEVPSERPLGLGDCLWVDHAVFRLSTNDHLRNRDV
jgi:hypothetical protein